MKLGNPTGVYIPVSEVFPSIQNNFETFRSLLQGLSRTDSLFWCARLNLIISCPSDSHRMIGQDAGLDFVKRQQYGIYSLCNKEEISAIHDYICKKGADQRVVIFFRGQLLELMRWITLFCHDHPEDGKTFDCPEIRSRLVQVALIASDIWAKRVCENRFSLENGIEIARQKSLGAIRKCTEAVIPAMDVSRSLGRGCTLFEEHFPNYYPCFKKEFQTLTGLSIEEYYNCLSAMIMNYMVPKINTDWNGIFEISHLGATTPYKDMLQKYIALESQTVDELRERLWGNIKGKTKNEEGTQYYDYKPLREKPILFAKDGRAIILDPVFYSDKVAVGPLFHLTNNRTRDEANRIFSAFGEAFERYTGDILKRMFPDIPGALSKRLACNINGFDKAGNEIEIDACLNDVREIVLFEIKAVWIPESEILGDEYEKYLFKRYVLTDGTNRDRKNKGIAQLARIINVLASKEWLGQNQEFSETQLIYPVLLLHDSFFLAPVYGKFLASKFEELIMPDDVLRSGELKKGDVRIAPLIIMTIEDLENLEFSIEYFGFRDFLADYCKASPDRMDSVHNFIAFSSKYNQKIYRNKAITAKGADLLQRSIKAVFGKDVSERI